MQTKQSVVLVTGAGRGIGEGLALDFGRAGARVAVHFYIEEEAARETCLRIREAGGDASPFRADLSSGEQRERLFREVVDRFGRLDALINNAGLDPGTVDFLSSTESQYDAVLNVNLKAVYFCAQLAARRMIEQGTGGRIVNISSIHGQSTIPHRTAYAASKGGLNALTRALALDLAPHRIQVNAIAPGFIEVARSRDSIPDYDRAEAGRRIPSGRVGLPTDVGALALFLASPEAEFITGQVIACDGGTTSLMAF